MENKINSKLYNYSLYLLGRRDYSIKELKNKFKEKKYEDSDIQLVLDCIIEKGYQSEERFVRSFINSKLNSKIGLSKIKSLLVFEKGINKEFVENILEEFEIDEVDTILSLLNVKYRNKDLTDFKVKGKAFRFLVSKGFGFSDINKAFNGLE